MNKLPIISVAVVAMTAAHADTLTLTTSDASKKSSFDTWNVSGGGTEAPSSGNDYVVNGRKHIRVLYNRTFGGHSLTFGTGTSATDNYGGLVVQRADSSAGHSIGFGNEGAILQNGYFTPWESDRMPTITTAGPLTVKAVENNPFRISAAEVTESSANTNNSWTIAAPIKGDAGSALMLCAGGKRNGVVYAPARADTFTITGSMAEFYGKLIVSGGLAGSAREAVPVSALFESITMGGTTVVQRAAQIKARYTDRTYTTAGLELQSGSILLVNNKVAESKCGKIVVTESLTVEKGAIIKLGTHPYSGSNFDAYDWVALTLPASKGTIPLENFGCPDVDGIPPCTLSTNLVDGVWQLVIHKDAHDVLQANDSTSTTISQAHPSACTNAASWKSGNAPESGKIYIAADGIGGLASGTWPVIRTPYYPNTATPFVFAGDALVIGQGGNILPCTKDVTFKKLVLSVNSTYVLSLASVPAYLRGSLYLRSSSDTYPQKIQAYMRGLSTVAAEVSGPGTLHVIGRSGSGNPYGDIEFTALNTNFTGRITISGTNVANKATGSGDYEHERVFVTDARNLGGPLDEFCANALELVGYSVLEARNDVDMNVANRGITVTGNAGFAAPANVTLAISNDITWNGTVRKTGAGTLALNGAARVASGATATLAVEAGYLSVGATNALDGVTVTFSSGAYLLVDPAATGDVATLGAVDLSATPFGGVLPVAFALPGLETGETYSYSDVAVCTVADAATAEALSVSAKKVSGHSVKFSVRENADGTATVLAAVMARGFIMTIH